MRYRILRQLALLIVASNWLLQAGYSQVHEPSPALEVGRKVQALNAQVTTRSNQDLRRYTPERVRLLTAEIRSLFTDYILKQLNQPTPSEPASLADELRTIQGEYRFPQDVTNTPFVSRSTLRSQPVYFASYLINRGGLGAPDSEAVIQAFVGRKEKYLLAAEGGAEFRGHTLHLQQIGARREGELWLLAHGVRFGTSHSDLVVVLYSFDGKSLRPIWRSPVLARGEISVEADGIRLKYLDLRRYQESKPPYFRMERFLFSPRGLELEKRPGG